MNTTFHALMIDIDDDFPNTLSNDGKYRPLRGIVNAVERVELLLTSRLSDLRAGGRLKTQKLIAPNVGGQPGGDASSCPTAATLRKALAEPDDAAQLGDQAYIYAGHCGRVSTRWRGFKGNDGVDEAPVPTDTWLVASPGIPLYTGPERYIRVRAARRADPTNSPSRDRTSDRGVAVNDVVDQHPVAVGRLSRLDRWNSSPV